MKKLIRRGLGPAFESVVSRLDPSVDPQEHLRFVESVLGIGPPSGIAQLPGAHTQVTRCCDSLGIAAPNWIKPHEQPDEKSAAAFQHPLEPRRARSNGASPTLTSFSAARWEDDPISAAACAASTLECLWSGQVGADAASRALRPLIDGLEPRRWFLLRRGSLHGTADLLRAGLLLSDDSGARAETSVVRAYLREVLDRTLRHLEVRREEALPLADTSLSAGADVDLERIRFSLALLDGADVFADLRYLNTALKTQDWHLRGLEATRPATRDPSWTLRFLHYLAALARQEEQMRRAFAC
jgi:hypothetical protein